jgi:hypothetical protein
MRVQRSARRALFAGFINVRAYLQMFLEALFADVPPQ